MNLAAAILAGGQGSGCRGPNCGRHKKEADRVIQVLRQIPGAEPSVVGSVANGTQKPDSDIDIRMKTDAEEINGKYDHERFFDAMKKLGYGFAGFTNHGETWDHKSNGHRLDFWFEEDTGLN